MEPWDGPASVAFTDGKNIGAVLDRNGLRPSRYIVTKDDRVIMASEVGALEIAPENVSKKGRLEPGKMFLVDLEQGRIVNDEELKHQIASARPYGKWLREFMVSLADLPPAPGHPGARSPNAAATPAGVRLHAGRPQVHTWPDGDEWRGSDRLDGQRLTPGRALRPRQPLFNYFKQLFAQVTNPPLDAIREELVTSVFTGAGGEGNLLEPRPDSCRQIALDLPIVDNDQMARLKQLDGWRGFTSVTLPMLFVAAEGAAGMERALESLFEKANAAITEGASLIILSDRGTTAEMAAIPSLLACSGLHHYLVRKGQRSRAGLLIECGDAREVHHFALLLGYGAGTINPYVAFETLDNMIQPRFSQGHGSRGGDLPLSQSDQEGGRQGDVQDGHQHDPELSRSPDLRGDRPERGHSSTTTSTRLPREWAASVWRRSPGRRSSTTVRPTPSAMPARRCFLKEASTSGAGMASITSSTPKRSSGSSTRPRPAAMISSRNTRAWSTSKTSG